MNTLTNQQQPLTKEQSQRRNTGQQAKQQKATDSRQGEARQQAPQQQEEGLYQLVKQDEALRVYHTAKLLDTPGYSHLSVEEAGDRVEQMLRLTTLMYEMLLEQGRAPVKEHDVTMTSAVIKSNQDLTWQQQVR